MTLNDIGGTSIRRIMFLGALMGAFVVSGAAQAHPMPSQTRAKELYFAHRCSQTNTLACIHRAAFHWRVAYGSMKYIAHRESGYQAGAKNPGSTASGLFQFLSSTWAGGWNPYRGISVFDAKANALAAGYAMHLGYWSWWSCC